MLIVTTTLMVLFILTLIAVGFRAINENNQTAFLVSIIIMAIQIMALWVMWSGLM